MADTHWYECWFQPRLGRLADELPYLNVKVEIHSGAPPGTGRTADLAIEFSSPDSGGTWLFSDYLAPVATPSIYNLFYGDGGPKILEGKPLLHLDNYHTDPRALDWPAWFNMFGHRTKGFNRGIRYTSFSRTRADVMRVLLW